MVLFGRDEDHNGQTLSCVAARFNAAVLFSVRTLPRFLAIFQIMMQLCRILPVTLVRVHPKP